ncbi:MAG: ATP-dependent Clp protease ATP-binding subunit [Deltaproteobacteria bacterium]|nr:ATP-dependent Clp protease ATP-binding subunit [Deltaproteobacteria bacterium]
MRLPWSRELTQVLADAEEIARGARKPFDSTHLLLALFTIPNRAQVTLRERGVDDDRLIDLVDKTRTESADVVPAIRERARQIAESQLWPEVDCLHLLTAVARTRESRAYELLERCGIDLIQLRTQIVSYFTSGNIPRRLGGARSTTTTTISRESPGPRPPSGSFLDDDIASPHEPQSQKSADQHVGEPPSQSLLSPRPAAPPTSPPAPSTASVVRLPPRPAPSAPPLDAPSRDVRAEVQVVTAPATPAHTDRARSPVTLSPDDYPWLTSLGRNLSQLAWDGRLDPLIGREDEIEAALDILHKRRANNPCLVGDPGVGKTALVEGLAARLLEEDRRTGSLGAHIIVELNMGTLIAGTQLRGSFSERLAGIQAEVRRGQGRVIVFIDEIHNLIGAGATGDSSLDAANELKAALARGEFPCIGATTEDEYQAHIARDSALARRFQAIEIREPTSDEAVAILRGVAPSYEAHHRVAYDDAARLAAVRLSIRFITDRHLPDKAIAVLDQAGARTRREGRGRVTWEDVARAVAAAAKVPVDKVVGSGDDGLAVLTRNLSRDIVGQIAARDAIAETLRRNLAGFHGDHPAASFLFVGPPGVGKSRIAACLAESLFDTPKALTSFDMSDFGEPLTASRLTGAAPGYVGHDRGGELTESLRRRPHQIVLLESIDRAHADVHAIVAQLLDSGRLTDSRGRSVDARNTIVIATMTTEFREAGRRTGGIGFGTKKAERGAAPAHGGSAEDATLLESAAKSLSPALWARLDAKLVFRALTRDEIRRIVEIEIARSSAQLRTDRGIDFALSPAAIDFVTQAASVDPALGAHPIRAACQRLIEAEIARRIFAGEFHPGSRVHVGREGDVLDFCAAPSAS